ncbi:TfoX/Sxy family protein [Cronobacter sakazakii]
MSVSREYVTFVLDQLAPLGAVETRRMFGCVALFQAGRMFALVEDNQELLRWAHEGIAAAMRAPEKKPRKTTKKPGVKA